MRENDFESHDTSRYSFWKGYRTVKYCHYSELRMLAIVYPIFGFSVPGYISFIRPQNRVQGTTEQKTE